MHAGHSRVGPGVQRCRSGSIGLATASRPQPRRPRRPTLPAVRYAPFRNSIPATAASAEASNAAGGTVRPFLGHNLKAALDGEGRNIHPPNWPRKCRLRRRESVARSSTKASVGARFGVLSIDLAFKNTLATLEVFKMKSCPDRLGLTGNQIDGRKGHRTPLLKSKPCINMI